MFSASLILTLIATFILGKHSLARHFLGYLHILTLCITKWLKSFPIELLPFVGAGGRVFPSFFLKCEWKGEEKKWGDNGGKSKLLPDYFPLLGNKPCLKSCYGDRYNRGQQLLSSRSKIVMPSY